MAAVGRVLQILGWLWVAAGFLGPLVNLPNVSWFPGFILIFVSRIFRAQASRASRADEEDDTPIPNVERPPDPPRVERRPAPDRAEPPPVIVEPSRAEIEQRLLEAMTEKSEIDDEARVVEPLGQADHMERPKTSAELIAEARQRWNKRP